MFGCVWNFGENGEKCYVIIVWGYKTPHSKCSNDFLEHAFLGVLWFPRCSEDIPIISWDFWLLNQTYLACLLGWFDAQLYFLSTHVLLFCSNHPTPHIFAPDMSFLKFSKQKCLQKDNPNNSLNKAYLSKAKDLLKKYTQNLEKKNNSTIKKAQKGLLKTRINKSKKTHYDMENPLFHHFSNPNRLRFHRGPSAIHRRTST